MSIRTETKSCLGFPSGMVFGRLANLAEPTPPSVAKSEKFHQPSAHIHLDTSPTFFFFPRQFHSYHINIILLHSPSYPMQATIPQTDTHTLTNQTTKYHLPKYHLPNKFQLDLAATGISKDRIWQPAQSRTTSALPLCIQVPQG